MKHYLITLTILLLSLGLKAQSGFTYHCWFDQDTEHRQTGLLGDGHLLLDADELEVGVHMLHVTLEGSGLTSPQTYLFYKFDPTQASPDLVYHYWFDQDTEHRQSGLLGDGHLLLDADDLDVGVHMLHVTLEGGGLNAPQSYLFYKFDTTQGSSDLVYHCWFDQDTEHRQTGQLGDGQLLLDVDDLETGVHMLHVTLEGNILTSPQTYLFYKTEPIGEENPNYVLHYWFDDENTVVHSQPVESAFEFEVGDLPDGLHALRVQLDNGKFSVPQCYWFYKRPIGGYVSGWEYWLNDGNDNHVTKVSPNEDTLNIITLLPVEQCPIRSTCFHFHPNGDAPYINAKNKITFRVWLWDSFVDKSAMYIDENVSEPIVADTFERNTTVSIAAPRDNQIHWFKLEANRGDYLSLQADKACTMQLFAPSGEEVYAVLGPESIQEIGFNVWEDGVYYLAVHDVTGSGETVSVTYNWVYRYVIASYDVHLVGNGGRSTITFQGNGFNSLLDVYLVNVQNDTIRPMNIGHESNTTTSITYDFSGAELGYYKAVFHFIDEDLTIENCITVEEATPFEFEVSASFASQFLINTGNKYVFQVRNKSNMTAYNVPIEVHIFNPNAESLTRVDIDGFDFKSFIIKMYNLYSSYDIDSLETVIEQKRLISGDMYGLVEYFNTDFISDAPYVYYTFMSPNLRPNTTETFTIEVKSIDMVYVYMWYPEEWENGDQVGNLLMTKYTSADIECQWYELTYNKPCPNNPPQPPGDGHPHQGGGSVPVYSIDPNDILGYLSESGSHYMRQEIQNVQYEIEFENDTTLATAAAHTIIVRDTLDATKFDLNSLAARSVTIGDKRLDLNGEQTFARTLDLRPELYVIAQINQDYDPTTGIIQWTIQSLDPMTMEPTDDPNQGVLPVNYYGNGVGFIDYSVNLKQAFADGTEISNRAGIIFVQNDVIMTPIWTNIIDAVKPVSYIEEVTFEDDTLNFSFVSSDNRSGVWYHTLYYRNDSTEMEWKVKVPKIEENNYLLYFDEYQTTEYLVMAVDSAGNHEDKDMVAEYVYYYDGPEPVCQTISLTAGVNWISTYVDITLDDLETALVTAMPNTNSITIKGKNASTTYNGIRWRGQLNTLDVTQMYRISVGTDCEITLEGVSFNPAEHPVTIVPGVNWIGFPLCESMSLSNAFAEFTVSGDMVKSKNQGIATYNGTQWRGSLNTLVPGQGYIYKSTTTEDRILTFPVGTK